MIQVEMFYNANSFRVNEWLKKNSDKHIIDIKHSINSNNNVVVMIVYEKV